MKKYFLIVLVFAIISCGKKSGDVAPPATPDKLVNMATKTVVVKETSTYQNTYLTYPKEVTNYIYNSNNTLTHVIKGDVDTEYKYDAIGRLLSVGKVGSSQYFIFTYNVDGMVADCTETDYDANGNTSQILVLKYIVTNGLVTSISYNTNNIPQYKYDFTYDSNGNIATQQITNLQANSKSSATFTYGTHRSRFYNSLFKFFYFCVGGYDMFNKNEVLIRKDDAQPNAVNTLYSYTFINNNYPVTLYYQSPGFDLKGSEAVSMKASYEYANL